jgi:integrase
VELRDTPLVEERTVRRQAVPAVPRPLGPEDAVFVGRDRRPVDQSAVLNRQVRPAAAAIGAPKLGWHDLRRTFATLADQVGMTLGERQALMGHARAAMTMAYTHTPSELAIAALDRLGERLRPALPETVQ